MKCEHCKQNDATVHLAQCTGGKVVKMHLCEPCAESKGINIKQPVSLSDLLAGLDEPEDVADEEQTDEELLMDVCCRDCEMPFAEYKRRGRLGCPGCYDAFAGYLHSQVLSVHGAQVHKGKRPCMPSGQDRESALWDLLARMELAVCEEDYELAARLRDELKQFEEEPELYDF